VTGPDAPLRGLGWTCAGPHIDVTESLSKASGPSDDPPGLFAFVAHQSISGPLPSPVEHLSRPGTPRATERSR
jgi:hypothetical protein